MSHHLIYSGPPKNLRVRNALIFKGPTTNQVRVAKEPIAPHLEPIPQLKRYQTEHAPSYIRQRNLERLQDDGYLFEEDDESSAKRSRRSGSIEPLDAEMNDLPELPDCLKEKQAELERSMTPPCRAATMPKKKLKPTKLAKNHQTQPAHLLVKKPITMEDLEGLRDMSEIIKAVKAESALGFLYLSPAVPKSSVEYHYYNLKVVPYEKINRSDHCTISQKGVARMRTDDGVDFVYFERWQWEFSCFSKLRQIGVFKKFRIWKAFSVWRKNVRAEKIREAKEGLEENLFIVNDSLRPALLNVREMCYRIGDWGLCRVDLDHTYALTEFKDAQFQQLSEFTAHLIDFRQLIMEVVRSACRTALLEAGFTPDDYFFDMTNEESALGDGGPPRTASSYMAQSNYDMDIFGKAPDQMTYTEQANKRHHCQRLTRFIRLSDYLIVNTLHVLAVNSVKTLLQKLLEHLEKTPDTEIIQTWEEQVKRAEAEKARIAKEKEKHRAQHGSAGPPPGTMAVEEPLEEKDPIPLFVTEFVLSLEDIAFNPSEDDFQESLAEIIKKFQDGVLSVPNLTPDTYFDAFTRPIINSKFEEKTCGDGPSLAAMFDDDKNLRSLIDQIREVVVLAFQAAQTYRSTFAKYQAFFKVNEEEDLEHMKVDTHDVPWFTRSLKLYHKQHKKALKIIEKRPLGLLLLDAVMMKSLLTPNPIRCLDAIHDILPKLARSEVDRLIAELQDAQFQLEIVPQTTTEYVSSLTFLDSIQDRIDGLEYEAETVASMYELIERYDVPTPPEDFAVYQTLNPSIGSVKNAIDRALGDRDLNIEKFCARLDKDIAELNKEVKEIKQASQDPAILNAHSNKTKIIESMNRFDAQLGAMQAKVFEYKSYQKNFKVEVTKYELLEEVHAEVKLKILLWNSLDEWDAMLDDLTDKPLDELDTESLNSTVMKYTKALNKLDKGLPPNNVVPLLKHRVESMREKVPTITDLINPNLKKRHWEEIYDIIGKEFTKEDPLTLGKLVEIDAFQHAEQLRDVSGKASSEASLEQILRKVEDTWKSAEFIVLNHKGAKDIFILGITDDIQQLWDESNINVATISSSKHVGPIKPRVDDWVKQLDLFGKTLDEWVNCQRSWLYLESIFSAPDIQRQLPAEAKMFMQVDKSYKDIMRKVNKVGLAMRAATQPGLLETFQNNNALLDQIMKCLEAYLESKRVIFPRFYFLSNDELLEILAQTRNPLAVQPHLRKCFDAISRLEFAIKESDKKSEDEEQSTQGQESNVEVQYTNDILAMISPEREIVRFDKGLKARGNVEDWLGKVEEAMFSNLRRIVKQSLADYENHEREDWLRLYPSQVVLTVSQMIWCRDITSILESKVDRQVGMKNFETKSYSDLNKLAAVVRGDLPPLVRSVLCALITIDVHARDMVSGMVNSNCDSVSSFEWQKQLRYYWDIDLDNAVVRMSSAMYVYGYEYLGCSPRLVITPLTDRCYLCLLGALQLDLGGAPAGPAGTGKTETTKDLAKSVATMCVVFNCSDGLDYKMMGRFFSGLAQSGGWCCFDEFNRIDIEVLSVIAQQLITIRNAKAAKLSRFIFEGREIKLVPTAAAFITMNPGYAGRTELPDNLKALFRPISMMVPDYKLIAEVILYSEGFESSKPLAQKMTQMYKLCSEQLSQQDHYDFGMRALKSVLVMAGSLKRQNPDKNEDVVLIRALRDSNLPKFLKDDAVLFEAILLDLFPGVDIPEHDYGKLLEEIQRVAQINGLQVNSTQSKKVIELYETLVVRHGVMLVGPTGGGKTTVYNSLAQTLTNLHKAGDDNPFYQPVHNHIMNPKSITMEELYGGVDKLTFEWKDGIMGLTIRECVTDTSKDHHWVVCDGPVDALWIENMNTVLDDNKMLCLANSERIKFTPYIHMLFEVEDLRVASPATVSRCGMVYVDSKELGWRPYAQTWMKRVIRPNFEEISSGYIWELFDKYIDAGLLFVSKNCTQVMVQVEISKVICVCKLYESLVSDRGILPSANDVNKLHPLLCSTFVFCYLWGIGGNLSETSWDAFDTFVRQQFEEQGEAKLPSMGDLWSHYVDFRSRRFEPWERIVPQFRYDPKVPFFEMLVPTVDTTRYGYLLEKMVAVEQSVLFTGFSGVGKSEISRKKLNDLMEPNGIVLPIWINFSAQTSSFRTQEIVEGKLEKKRKTILGAPEGKKIVIFVDDLNMPKLDRYGSQPPIELLRQYQDFGGLYDRAKWFWKEIKDVIICSACGPPGGGRNHVTARFIRHFGMFALPSPPDHVLKGMFSSILVGFLTDFPLPVRQQADPIVSASVEIYFSLSQDLLPTPAKSHYVFNLRDLSKCVQGVLQADVGVIREKDQIFRLFCHEAQRVFHDRLINEEDKSYFHRLMSEMAQKYFGIEIEAENFVKNPIIFGDFMKIGAEPDDRVYEELPDLVKVKTILQDYLDDYNLSSQKEMSLVLFLDAIKHISRLIRIIKLERGNALLVGVGGTGKQSLTRLAAHICGYQCVQIELTRGYDYSNFRDDLKKLYTVAGVENLNTVFLFTDTQIVVEEFLEDINNILNSGEVPNLFEPDEYERLIIGCRVGAKAAGIPEGDRDGIFKFCLNRVRNNLHIVLSMSPVGNQFRSRCRMFPSLVNCCTIDWFTEWPEDALLSVARSVFEKVDVGDAKNIDRDALIENLATFCVEVHVSISEMAERFYLELRRRYYTTPTSYLELLNLYFTMLSDKRKQLTKARDRVKFGIEKLIDTNALVHKMEIELVALEPQLNTKSEETQQLMEKLVVDQEKADAQRRVVMDDEAVAKVKAEETQNIADDAQADLDHAMPELEASIRALDALDKTDIAEIRVFTKPPELVQTVMEAVCLLLGAKTDWAAAKSVLGDQNFLRRLYELDKDNIKESVLKKLKVYIDNPKFTPDEVQKVSKACRSMCMWVRAMDMYARVFKTVKPKKEKLATAQKELDAVMTVLNEKQSALASVEARIQQLQQSYDDSVKSKQQLERNIAQTQARLRRAGKLTTSLADEQGRWKESVEQFNIDLGHVVGDMFIAAACVAYYGAFTSDYRQKLVEKWVSRCAELSIPVSDNFSLVTVLGDPYEIRQWNTEGLPRDQLSTENAILVTKARRWPLMIDPQEQANRWVRNMEGKNGLRIIKMNDGQFLRVLENCIRIGMPVLLEDVEEFLDPSLEPVLLKQTFMQAGRLLIRLGDNDVDYDRNFRFYMTSKMANPHYLPEVSIKVTLINFTVTKSGLEDQLLGDVVKFERPELEEQRNQLIVRINTDKNQLNSIEDRILKLLFESEGNVLDNEDLINTLNDSKVTSAAIKHRLAEAEVTEEKISAARNKFTSVATRGSVLYFVVADIGQIDPMYQFSLKYFKGIFNATIESSEKSEILEERLQILINDTTVAVYNNVARGLFESDKLAFSFMLCGEIKKESGEIHLDQWNFLLRGAAGIEKERPPKPEFEWLSEKQWKGACEASDFLVAFRNLNTDLTLTPCWVECAGYTIRANPEFWSYKHLDPPLPEGDQSETEVGQVKGHWEKRLSDFEKLIFVKIFAEEKLIFSIQDFVANHLGKQFVESPPIDLPSVYLNLNKTTPLVFVLSTGSDPMGAFTRFAKEQDYLERVDSISLGQGQGPVAERMMISAFKSGNWVFLQNCHLAQSWMPVMENMVKEFQENPLELHDDFRLFLSSMPAKHFPVSVLQNSVKITNEPPKGIRANLKRAFSEQSATTFEDNILGQDWRKAVFGLCFFHAAILERKKFGPLGWNIKYAFSDSDRECALLNLQMFTADGYFPWDSLQYITGEITYGGRVTDFWDQRCLRTVLKRFFSPDTLTKNFKYSESGVYYAPEDDTLAAYRGYIDELPLFDGPDIFGMHENANIAFQQQQSGALVSTVLDVQPRLVASSGGKSSDEIVYELAESILERVPEKLNIDKANDAIFQLDQKGRVNSLTTVLTQEVDRFNKLLRVIKQSLENLMKAIKGFIVMSEDLEALYTSFMNSQVPVEWANNAYPSLKPLGSWVLDLLMRCDFVDSWIVRGLPKSFWISGFSFPQGFLTGTLQLHARRYDLPIDRLSFKFEVLPHHRDQAVIMEKSKTLKYGEELDEDAELPPFDDGVMVHGLFIEGFRWDMKKMVCADSLPGQMIDVLPVMHMEPSFDFEPDPKDYIAPIYKTGERAGVLSTTGMSTNFVVAAHLPSNKPQDYWISTGGALLCQSNH